MKSEPLIISHRGDTTDAAENTILACEKALEKGATALEIDIRDCASGETVVFHDFSIKRMFNKPGYVGRIPLSLLRTYPYIHPTSNNQHINTLDEFLDHFKNRVPLNLDAKTIHFFDFKFADKIISIIKNHNLMDTIWVSCFNPFLLQILKMKDKRIKTGYLFQNMSWMNTMYDHIVWTDAWHPHFNLVNQKLLLKAKKHSKEIYVWTVNESSDFEKIKQFPLDGIITDKVSKIKRIYQNL
jgi:glycerophosphoryl diester phosphodiesterase